MKNKFLLSLLCGVSFVAGSLSAAGAANSDAYNRNWPQWRGPAGNGLVLQGNPPLEWGEGKNVKWKVKIPGSGHATPVIWQDKIFILTAVPAGAPAQAALRVNVAAQVQQQEPGRRRGGGGRGGRGGGGPTEKYAFTTLCLDRKDGSILWERVSNEEVPHQGIQRANSYSSGSPVTDGEHVYVYFGSYGVYCYDMAGNLVWKKDLGKVNVTFGEASSPTLWKNLLLVLQDNNGESSIYAFDKLTGKEVWKKSRDEGSGWTTPYILEYAGKTQVVVNGSNAVRSYDPATGELLWQCSGLGSNPVPTIVSDSDTVYALSGHREPMGLAIKLGGSGDLTGTDAVRWKTDRGTPYVPSPLLYDGLLFFCQKTSSTVTCMDAQTGKAHYEQERLDGISGVYASPIGVNNRIYLAGQNGTTLVLEKSKELKVLASNKLEDGFDASPAVVGNELFLRGRENLYCLVAN